MTLLDAPNSPAANAAPNPSHRVTSHITPAAPQTTPNALACGFSFGKNLSKLNYPVEQAVQSILPVCAEFVFAVGESEDDSRDRIAAIDTSMMNHGRGGQITIIDTVWDASGVNGNVLAIQANKAMAAATTQATATTTSTAKTTASSPLIPWGFYIQADEVIHEDDLPRIQQAMQRHAENTAIKALLFRYLHFVLDYQTTDPWMYHKASRIVRLDHTCSIFGDACGPGLNHYSGKINDGYLDKNHLGSSVAWAKGDDGKKARVFHYGWVKTRQELQDKFNMVDDMWWSTRNSEEKSKLRTSRLGRIVDRYPHLKTFRQTHPALMAKRIAQHPPFDQTPNRWLQPRFYAECLRHGFHG